MTTQDDLTIRFATPCDAEALADIYEHSWRFAYQGIIPHLHLERMIAKRGPGWWQHSLCAHGNVLLLEFDGAIGGYSSVGCNRSPLLPYGGEVQELYMMPAYQGLGLGEKLFAASRKALKEKGLEGLVVWALEDNAQACLFYLRRGGRLVAKSHERFGERCLDKIAFGWCK